MYVVYEVLQFSVIWLSDHMQTFGYEEKSAVASQRSSIVFKVIKGFPTLTAEWQRKLLTVRGAT